MADDTERQIVEKIKKSELFALQLDESTHIQNKSILLTYVRYTRDRLCGLVVGVSDYRYRGLGFYSRRYQIFWVVVGLERGPLSLVRSIEELLE